MGAGSRSDERLLTASVAESELFVAFYDHHARRLLAFFVRRTFDAQVAADLTAEAFAQVFAARARFRGPGPGSAAAWLQTIACRQLNRYIGKQRVERRWRERLAMDPLNVASDAMERAEELIDLEALRGVIAAALERLSPAERQAVVARVLDGKSYTEAVHGRLHRAGGARSRQPSPEAAGRAAGRAWGGPRWIASAGSSMNCAASS